MASQFCREHPFLFFRSFGPTFRNTPPRGVKPPCFGRSAFTGSQLVRVQRVAFLVVFDALRVSLCWPRNFLRRGALLSYTANGAHYSLRV